MAFGYCRCLHLCVCVSVCQSVCQSLACPRDNSRPVQVRITKFGPTVQSNLIKVVIVLWTDRHWPSRSNTRSNSKFTPFWFCLQNNSSPIQAKITKFGECPSPKVRSPKVAFDYPENIPFDSLWKRDIILIKSTFGNGWILDHFGPISLLRWQNKDWKLWFPTNICNTNQSIYFKLDVYLLG